MNTHLRIYALVLIFCTAPYSFAMEKPIAREENDTLYAWVACQGNHRRMEDEAIVHQYPDGTSAALVCDGYNGEDVANHAIKRMPELLQAKLKDAPDRNKERIKQLLIDVFKECDQEIEQQYPSTRQGTTASLVYLDHGRVYVAHVGNSPVSLFDKAGETIFNTTDHRLGVSYPIESRRVGEQNIRDNLLFGKLKISRTLGNFRLKERGRNILIAKPDVSCQPFGPGYTVVITSDGVTDFYTPYSVVSDIRNWIEETKWMQQQSCLKHSIISRFGHDYSKNTRQAANSERALQLPLYLINRALEASSSDNMTALILHNAGDQPCIMHEGWDVDSKDELLF